MPQHLPADRDSQKAEEVARLAEERSPGLIREFWFFLLHNKRWWLAPIIIILLLVGLLVVLSGSAFAPFIYPVF